jgi:hypothetical protein
MSLKKIAVLFIIFIITFTIPSIGKLDSSITVGPYPQSPGSDFISILWETNVPTKENSVHYGLTAECNNVLYSNISNDFHEIKVDNLSSSKKYYYFVSSDEVESKIYSFYTLFDEDDEIRFIAYGDTRGVWDNWKNCTNVAEGIEKEKPFFVLHTGDIVNNGRKPNEWLDFFSASQFMHNSTLYTSLGNHEYYGEHYFKFFSLPNDEYWYSFDSGPVHFVALDSNIRNSLRISQIIWLIKDLRSNEKSFTIIFFHHPLYSSGNHGSTFYLRLFWGPIFNFFDVDIIFNGHDHSYERGDVRNINFIVTGGGGAPLYNIGNSWWTQYSEKSYHYCLLTASQNKLTLAAKNPDGKIIDKFDIIR